MTRKRIHGHFENAIANTIRRDGHTIEQQVPCGPYNLDLAFDENAVAVEVCLNNHSRPTAPQRLKCLFDKGWRFVLIVHRPQCRKDFNLRAVTDQCIAFRDVCRSLPPTVCRQYGMIGSNGQSVTPHRYDLNGWAR